MDIAAAARTPARRPDRTPASAPALALAFAALLAPDAAPAATNDADAPDETVVVHGRAGSGIVARVSGAATKTRTPLVETPQSVSTVTRAQMDQQDVQNVDAALAYSAGVATSQRGGDAARYDQLTIRGFTGATGGPDQYLDGLRLLNGAYYASQQLDPFLLDEIDVVKGPASVVYGQSSPGGIIAETSKLPSATAVHTLLLEGGSFDTLRGVVDLGGPLAGQTWLYRFAATGLRADGQQAGTRIRRYAFAPAISWNPDPRTSVTVLARFQRDPAAGAYSSAPAVGTVLLNPLGRLGNDFYNGDASDEIFDRTQSSLGAILDRALAGSWHVRSLARYTSMGAVDQGLYGADYAPGSFTTLLRNTYGSKENVDALALDERLIGNVRTGTIRHDVLLGVGYENLRDAYDYGSGPAPPLDVFAPVRGLPIAHPPVSLAVGQTTGTEGVYAQDQMAFGHVRVTIGGREDWSVTSTRNALATDPPTAQSDRAFTFRGGILYLFDNGLAPYFNYAQSFEPQGGTDVAGGAFPATRGEQFEVGLKYQPHGIPGFVTGALYDLTQTNVLASDQAHPGFSAATGAVRARGLELEAHATIAPDLDLIAAWTVQDVAYVDGDAALVGKRPGQVPASFGSFWAQERLPAGPLAGLGAAIGLRVNGNTNVLDTSGVSPEFTTHGFTLVDARIEYELWHALPALKGTTVAVNATNLFDTDYVSSCYAGLGCFLGADRTVSAQLRASW